MRAGWLAGLVLVAACDWDAAEQAARCAQLGTCGNVDGGASDSGVSDAGSRDAGHRDAGAADSGLTDAGDADAGLTDAGDADAGLTDAGDADAGLTDAGSTDGESADAGIIDAGFVDAGSTDAGTTDAGSADAGSTDAGFSDAGSTDAGLTDAGKTDAGGTDAGGTSGGASDAGGTDAGSSDAGGILACTSIDSTIDDGGSFTRRTDTLLSSTGSAFALTFDDETVWSMLVFDGGTTQVLAGCDVVYSSTGAAKALHANGDVTRGVLIATGNQVVMMTRDAGQLGTLSVAARLVAISRSRDGGALASIWEDTVTAYATQLAELPSLANPTVLPQQSCNYVVLPDVEVLPAALGGTTIVSHLTTNCISGQVTQGMNLNGPGAQVITPEGVRRLSVMAAAYPSKVGRNATISAPDKFNFAYDFSGNSIFVGQTQDDGGLLGVASLSSDGGLRLGDVMGNQVLVAGAGELKRGFSSIARSDDDVVRLVAIPFGGPVVTIGPTPRTANRLGLYVDSPNNTAFVLWDRADGGVMLTTLK